MRHFAALNPDYAITQPLRLEVGRHAGFGAIAFATATFALGALLFCVAGAPAREPAPMTGRPLPVKSASLAR